MCFDRVRWEARSPEYPHPAKVKGAGIFKAWKWVDYTGKTSIEGFRYWRGRCDRWLVAGYKSYNEATDFASTEPNAGFHVFLDKKNAMANPHHGRVLVEVKVSGLIAVGEGDGYHNQALQVATFKYMKVPPNMKFKKKKSSF